MATYTFKVTPEKLTSTAVQFSGTGSQIRGLTMQMISIVNSLTGGWEGEAQRTYCDRFRKLDGDMNQIQAKIREHVQDLQAMARVYGQAERTNTQTASGLSSDFI